MPQMPIVPGFFPDPSVCRVGDVYYLVNSTFEYLPGVPVHRSSDLVTWTQIGNVYSRLEQLDLTDAPSNAGIYAPTIRHHDGRLYVVTSDLGTASEGHLISHARDAAGPWGKPVRVAGAIGIDPDLFWDDDGTCWLSWRGVFGHSEPGIHSAPIDPDSGVVVGAPKRLWQGIPGMSDAEGPHLYRRGSWYYCLLAQGGTSLGHSVTIARSRSLDGPWEPHPEGPILTHRSTDLPVQNTGHGDLVEMASGEWAMVFLGVRSRGVALRYTVNGRETFVAGIDWVDDWPVVREDAFPVPQTATSFSDAFEGGELDLRWISHGGAQWHAVDASASPGVRIRPVVGHETRPALSTRVRDEVWRAEAVVVPEDAVALQLRMDEDNWVEVVVDAAHVEVVQSITGVRHRIADRSLASEGAVALMISARPWPGTGLPLPGPDVVALGIRQGAQDLELAQVDGRLLSVEFAGGFTGRTVGLRAIGAPARLQAFSYRSESPAAP